MYYMNNRSSPMEASFQYPGQIQQITKIQKDLESLRSEWNLPRAEVRQILVVIEELFSILIHEKRPDNPAYLIEVKLNTEDNQIKLVMIDPGDPINPLIPKKTGGSAAFPSNDEPMGIMLIKTFVDSFNYSRENNKNIFTFYKTLKSKSN